MKRIIRLVLTTLSVVSILFACDTKTANVDNVDKGGEKEQKYNPDDIDDPDDLVEPKKKIQETGIEAIKKVKAYKFDDIVELIDYFTNTYGDYDIDDEYAEKIENLCDYQETRSALNSVLSVASSLMKAPLVATRDLATINAGIKDFYGTFYASTRDHVWNYSESDEGIEFVFNDEKGKKCSFLLTFSSSTQKVSVEGSDFYRSYSTSKVEEDKVIANVELPRSICLVIKQGTSELAKLDIDLSLSGDFEFELDETTSGESIFFVKHPSSIGLSFVLSVSDYKVEQVFAMSDSKCSCNITLSSEGEAFIDAECIINGNLGKPLDISTDWDDNMDYVDSYIKSAYANVNILDKVSVSVSCPSVSKLVDAYDAVVNLCDSEVKEKYRKAAAKLNDAVVGTVQYKGENDCLAKLEFGVDEYYDEWFGKSYYDVCPFLSFSDGTSYLIEQFVEDDEFEDLLDSFEKLIDDFEKLL